MLGPNTGAGQRGDKTLSDVAWGELKYLIGHAKTRLVHQAGLCICD